MIFSFSKKGMVLKLNVRFLQAQSLPLTAAVNLPKSVSLLLKSIATFSLMTSDTDSTLLFETVRLWFNSKRSHCNYANASWRSKRYALN